MRFPHPFLVSILKCILLFHDYSLGSFSGCTIDLKDGKNRSRKKIETCNLNPETVVLAR